MNTGEEVVVAAGGCPSATTSDIYRFNVVPFYFNCFSSISGGTGWRVRPNLPIPLYRNRMVFVNNRILMIGGYSTEFSLGTNGIYEMRHDESDWDLVTDLVLRQSIAKFSAIFY